MFKEAGVIKESQSEEEEGSRRDAATTWEKASAVSDVVGVDVAASVALAGVDAVVTFVGFSDEAANDIENFDTFLKNPPRLCGWDATTRWHETQKLRVHFQVKSKVFFG